MNSKSSGNTLDISLIKPLLRSPSIHLDLLTKVDSTSEYLKKNASPNQPITICCADMQTAGKGRLERKWHSPMGVNIYCSLLYPFKKDISELSGLSLVIGLAVCKAIASTCNIEQPIEVKWPNDIMINHKKLAGILIEIQTTENGFCRAIIGVGINVNMQQDDQHDISQPWTSLFNETGQWQDRNILCAELINQLIDYIDRFSKSSLCGFMQEWQTRDYLLNTNLQLKSNNKITSGLGAGINQDGHFILQLPNGEKQAFLSGETTIMK